MDEAKVEQLDAEGINWLADQLEAWPDRRVRDDRTMNIGTLHALAARHLRAFASLPPQPDVALAGELYESVRDIWHYARKGTGDAALFDVSERGIMLRRSMDRVAALRGTGQG